jgi:hypothetical protein
VIDPGEPEAVARVNIFSSGETLPLTLMDGAVDRCSAAGGVMMIPANQLCQVGGILGNGVGSPAPTSTWASTTRKGTGDGRANSDVEGTPYTTSRPDKIVVRRTVTAVSRTMAISQAGAR